MDVLLLVVLAANVTTGLLSGEEHGPGGLFLPLIAGPGEEGLAEIHEVLANLIVVLACLHILGVAADWLLTRENLVRAMITGKKMLDEESATEEQRPVSGPRLWSRPASCRAIRTLSRRWKMSSASTSTPPDQALVLSVEEKSQIQALDRTQPGLPMKKGRARPMTHDDKRPLRCSRRSTCSPAWSSAIACPAIAAGNSCGFSSRSTKRRRPISSCTRSSTTTPPTRPSRSDAGSRRIRAFIRTSPPPPPPGSTWSSASSPRSPKNTAAASSNWRPRSSPISNSRQPEAVRLDRFSALHPRKSRPRETSVGIGTLVATAIGLLMFAANQAARKATDARQAAGRTAAVGRPGPGEGGTPAMTACSMPAGEIGRGCRRVNGRKARNRTKPEIRYLFVTF
jgi:hypothetical protein